jgi:hypothetical protein
MVGCKEQIESDKCGRCNVERAVKFAAGGDMGWLRSRTREGGWRLVAMGKVGKVGRVEGRIVSTCIACNGGRVSAAGSWTCRHGGLVW